MTRRELLDKSDELTYAWMDKQAKLESYIQRWLSGETQMSAEGIQQLVDSANKQIDTLKAQAEQLEAEYKRIVKEEAMKNNAVISVRHNFGTSPDELVTTGGVLSSNANESHLEGRSKTSEELEMERQQLLATVRTKAMSKEITLAQASQMAQQINNAYGFNQNFEQENTQGGMRR